MKAVLSNHPVVHVLLVPTVQSSVVNDYLQQNTFENARHMRLSLSAHPLVYRQTHLAGQGRIGRVRVQGYLK